MPVQAARPAAAIALTTVLALSACGGGDEPQPKETTTSSTTDKEQLLSESAEDVYRKYRRYNSARPNSEVPGPGQKALMTKEAYESTAESAGRTAPTKLQGRDKLLSANAKVAKKSDRYVATLTACYEVHQRALALEAGDVEGESWKKGEDLRTGREGKTIKPGTIMGDRVTMHRGLAENTSWQVDNIDGDTNVDCSNRGSN